MRVGNYVLFMLVALLTVAAGTKIARPVEGVNPGDLAPKLKLSETQKEFNFKNHSGQYTLVNFWAAYDAESRANNVLLSHKMKQLNNGKITYYSISLDEKKSIFSETVKEDNLDQTSQIFAGTDKNSSLVKDYKLKKGLRNFLIDDKGIIIAANISPDNLANVLKEKM